MIQRFLSLLFIVPMMAFCSTPPQDNQENNNDPDPKDETKPVIVYEGEHEITVESAAGSGTLTFTCNTDWTAAGSKSG